MSLLWKEERFSDQYAIESQLRLHGMDPAKVLVEVFPRQVNTPSVRKISFQSSGHTATGLRWYCLVAFNITQASSSI